MTDVVARLQEALSNRYRLERELGQGGMVTGRCVCFGIGLLLLVVAGPLIAQCPDGTPPPCAVQRPAARLPSLAVLFMEPRSRNSADSLLAEGLTLDIIDMLVGVPRLDVRSRWVSRRIASAADPIRSAQALGVDYLVDGVLEVDSARVLVRGALTRTTTGRVLQSLRFERRRVELARLQSELAADVAAAVVGQLRPAERALFAVRHDDPQVTELILRAKPLVEQYTVAALRQAIALARQAVEVGPTSSRAWSALGSGFGYLLDFYPDSNAAFTDSARVAFDRALALDSSNGMALGARAATSALMNDLSPATEVMARRGAQLEPGTYTRNALAFVLMARGRVEEALTVTREAIRRDSLAPNAWAAAGYRFSGSRRFADAARAWERALALRPSPRDSSSLLMNRRWARLEAGDCEGALVEGRAARWYGLIIESLRCLGRTAEADSITDARLALPTLSPSNRAIYLAWRNQPDSAFAVLDRDFSWGLGFTLVHPAFDPYRQHPAYLVLRRRMGMEPW